MNNPETNIVIDRRVDDTIAFVNGKEISVQQFLANTKSLASRLPDRPYAINLAVDRYQYLMGFCAAVLRGQCTLMPFNRLDATLELIEREFPGSYRLEASDPLFEHLPGDSGDKYDWPVAVPLDQLCAIAFTSGSTGVPTYHRKFWRTLVVSTGSSARLLDLPRDKTINLVATIPAQHMWGLETSILFPMLERVAICAQSPFYPADIVRALAEMPEPRGLVSSPVHLDALMRSGLQIPPLDRIYSATAPISRDQAFHLEEQFSTRIIEAFGCSETGIISGRETAREELWRISDSLSIEACNDEFMVKGEHLPEAVPLPDKIEMHEGNRFRWVGRHQDMIKIGGKRESLSDLNLHLVAIKGVDDGVIFMPHSRSRRPAALVVSKHLGKRDVRAALGQHIDAVFLPRPIFLVDKIPRQETGKIARRELMACYEALMRKTSRKSA